MKNIFIMNTENENLAQAIKMIIKYENSINRAVRKYIIKDNMVLNNIFHHLKKEFYLLMLKNVKNIYKWEMK